MKKSWLGALLTMTVTLVCGCDFGSFCGANDANQAEVSIYVSDAATGKPVASPAFTEGGVADQAGCREPDANNPDLCTYDLLLLDQALHTIVVSAAGYEPQTVTVDTTTSLDAHLAVELRPVRAIADDKYEQ